MSDILKFMLDILRASLPRATVDWKPGDLAVCVQDPLPAQFAHPEMPKSGDLLRVTHVCHDNRFLHFEGKPEHLHWGAIFFRKPQEEPEETVEADWVEYLKRQHAKEPA